MVGSHPLFSVIIIIRLLPSSARYFTRGDSFYIGLSKVKEGPEAMPKFLIVVRV